MIPLISVIIPTYNHAHFLSRALQSVLDQTFTNWEAIVVDNHSQDNTDHILQAFQDPRISLLKINNNGIIAASRNLGIRSAKGQWIALLDSDDWWLPEKLEVCMKAAKNEVDLIYHDLEIVGNGSGLFKQKCIKSRRLKKPALTDLLANGNAIPTSSVVFRKKLFDELGGMSERKEIVAAEDYNTWLRIADITEQFCYIPETLGYYQVHGAGISQKDMSVPMRFAAEEFVHLLNKKQFNKFQSELKYANGRHNYVIEDYRNARKPLLFSLIHGRMEIKMKALYMLLQLDYKKFMK
jgi:glycosyltransferase involved in cell wall biosynthesis